MLLVLFTIIYLGASIQKGEEDQLLLQTGTMGGLGDELKPEVDRIKISLKLQNTALVKELKRATNERSGNISELSSDIKTILDKMAYVTDAKMTKINDRVQEHIYQTEAISLIILMDQLDKKVEELAKVKQQIKQLKAKIPKLSDKCNKYFTCYDCLQDENCGWCSMEDKCVEGDDKGPTKISCNFYSYSQCNGRQCHKYKTCATCISDPSCGWCIDDDRYMSGCLQQPYDYQGCPKGGWHHLEGKQNTCPATLRKVYEEEFDENAYWSKPFDDSQFQEDADTAEQDKNNALNGKGGLEETESKTEYNKKQQQVDKQIKDLEALAKEIQKEIDALQKRYKETVEWLDKFKGSEGGEGGDQQEEGGDAENPDEQQEDKPKDKKEEKKEAKAKKQEEKKQKEDDKKKKKEEEKKKAEEEKAKEKEKKKSEEDEKKQKKKEEEERKKEAKKKEEDKRAEVKKEMDEKNKEKEEEQEQNVAQDDNEDNESQEKEEGEKQDEQPTENTDAEKESSSNESAGKKQNDKNQKQKPQKQKAKQEGAAQQQGSAEEGEKEEKREIPDEFFREPELQNKSWEDLYNGNFQFVQHVEDDDELEFGTIDIVDDFYDPFHLN